MAHAGASPHWESMWSGGLGKGQAFDVGDVSATLAGELARKCHAPRPGMTALVPGCGRAYDALALARHGFDSVVAVDVAPTACEAARAWLSGSGDTAAAKVSVECADFFALQGEYDFIWDCTFLCALDLSVRKQWASKHSELLRTNGFLLTCIFPVCDKVGGPPFAMSVPLVRNLLQPTGLQAETILDPVPDAQRHRPGGVAANLGEVGTALAIWKHSSP